MERKATITVQSHAAYFEFQNYNAFATVLVPEDV